MRAVPALISIGLAASLFGYAAGPTSAQQNVNPFAGSLMPGAPGPYGSAAGAYVHLMQTFQTMLSGAPSLLSGVYAGGMPATPAAAPASSSGGGDRADAPDVPSSDESLWEIVVGACAGGAFLGAYSAATATVPAAATGVGAGATGTAVVSAAAIGCGLGVATAAVSLGAVRGWQSLQGQ